MTGPGDVNDHAEEINALLRKQAEELECRIDEMVTEEGSFTCGSDFYIRILSSLREGIAVLDRDGRIVMVNRAWYEVALNNGNNDPAKIGPGINYFAVLEESSRSGKLPAAAALQGMRDVLEGKSARFVQKYPRDSPSGRRWFVMYVTPFGARRDRLVISDVDVTKQQQAMEELDNFFELSPDMMAIAGFDGFFKKINPSWERTLGYSPEYLLSIPYMDLVHPDDRASTVGQAENLSRGMKVVQFENRYLARDGSVRWLSWTSMPLPAWQVVFAVARDVTEKKEIERKMQELNEMLNVQAITDSLTGILNHGAVLKRLREEVARSLRDGKPLGVIMSDIDYFKHVNDTYGHETGDVVLVETAGRISSICRPYDVVGRYGGEEFLIVLPGTGIAETRRIAERIRKAMAAEPFHSEKADITVTMSLGVFAATAGPAMNPGMLVRMADNALYRAKNNGRNRVAVADTEMPGQPGSLLSP